MATEPVDLQSMWVGIEHVQPGEQLDHRLLVDLGKCLSEIESLRAENERLREGVARLEAKAVADYDALNEIHDELSMAPSGEGALRALRIVRCALYPPANPETSDAD